jgi:hypothetical protein
MVPAALAGKRAFASLAPTSLGRVFIRWMIVIHRVSNEAHRAEGNSTLSRARNGSRFSIKAGRNCGNTSQAGSIMER